MTADRDAPAAGAAPPLQPLAASERARRAARDIRGETLPEAGPRPSRRLRFAAGYFKVTGWMMLVSGLLLLSLLAQFGPPHVTGPAHTVAPPPWTFALMLVQGAGHLWTGRLLSRRLRIGGQMALATLGLPVLDAIPYLLRGSPGGLYALLMSALGCALVLSVWRELD